jgi:hypothetical protein
MRKSWFLIATVFMVAVSLNGTALGFMTQHLSIPGNAFLPASDNFSYTREGSDIVPSDDSSHVWFAPLYLPDGARIGDLSLAAIICGNLTSSTEVDIGIWERDLATQAQTELVHLDIDGDTYECTLVGNPPPKFDILNIIDTESKTYFITVEGLTGGEFSKFGSLQLRAVRIAYYVSAGFNLD